MSRSLLDTVGRHKGGEAVGIYSVCSAHPLVIEASVQQALGDGGYLLVEATSNQVDQFGGYTGMKPRDFRNIVLNLARRHGLAEDRIVLGGDHLGAPDPAGRFGRRTSSVCTAATRARRRSIGQD